MCWIRSRGVERLCVVSIELDGKMEARIGRGESEFLVVEAAKMNGD